MPIPIKLYDSYLKNDIIIDPQTTVLADTLKMYSCGPTVYGYQHIGNMRAVWLGDTIIKTAKALGWNTEWVLNITDVGHLVGDGDGGKNIVSSEDKMEKTARLTGKTVEEIVSFYTNDYLAQTKALHLDLPKNMSDFQNDLNEGVVNPMASQWIKEQMVLALELLEDGKAYLLEDGIYFDSIANKGLVVPFKITDGDSEYTGRELKNVIKNSADFAVWKFVSENTLQKWKFYDVPEAVAVLSRCVVEGRIMNLWGCPGWHSECVAMITGILGRKLIKSRKKFTFVDFTVTPAIIDLHLGGEDHIDIHHKNEILQSEALGFHLSKYWVHNKFVLVDGKKMSKSLGNLYLVQGDPVVTGFDSLVSLNYDPLAYRLMMFEHHYTTQLDFTFDKLAQSQARLFGLRKEVAKIVSFQQNFGFTLDFDMEITAEIKAPFMQILADSLNTPKFVDMYQAKILEVSNGLAKDELDENDYQTIVELHQILKLDLWKYSPEKIKKLSLQRWEAKQDKDWAKADELRLEIESRGWMVDDYKWGYGLWYNPISK